MIVKSIERSLIFFLRSCADVCVNWPKIYYGYLTWRSLHTLGGMSPSMKEWYLPAKHPQVLGWHFVNYICYFIDLMFMPWQCLAVGPRGLGVQFHAKSELRPKALPLLCARTSVLMVTWIKELMLLQTNVFLPERFFSWISSCKLPVQEESSCEQGMWCELF